jgi:hypothetical protein
MQFRNAISTQSHSKHTAYFASSIRSAVLARQINRWLRDFPTQYQSWRRGEYFAGPTFFEDEAASIEAEKAWIQIDKSFQKMSHPRRRKLKLPQVTAIDQAYADWENSLL